jgi:hypothetical protein
MLNLFMIALFLQIKLTPKLEPLTDCWAAHKRIPTATEFSLPVNSAMGQFSAGMEQIPFKFAEGQLPKGMVE